MYNYSNNDEKMCGSSAGWSRKSSMSNGVDVNCDNCFYSGYCRGNEVCERFRFDNDEADDEYVINLVGEGRSDYISDWNSYVSEHQGCSLD